MVQGGPILIQHREQTDSSKFGRYPSQNLQRLLWYIMRSTAAVKAPLSDSHLTNCLGLFVSAPSVLSKVHTARNNVFRKIYILVPRLLAGEPNCHNVPMYAAQGWFALKSEPIQKMVIRCSMVWSALHVSSIPAKPVISWINPVALAPPINLLTYTETSFLLATAS